MAFAVTCFILLALLVVPGTALAQQRLSLADLDQRLTTVEEKPTPEQIATLRWFGARGGIVVPVGGFFSGTLGGIAFDGASIWLIDQILEGYFNVVKVRASDGFVEQRGDPLGPSLSPTLVFDGASIWVGIAGVGVRKLRASDLAFQGEFPLNHDIFGAAFDGANVWLAGNSKVTKLRASDGALQGTFSLKSTQFRGAVAFGGASIWVASGNKVTKLRASDVTLQGTFPVPGATGIAFDGTSMWVTGGDTVTKLRASDGTPLGTFPVSGATGIAFDGTSMWVTGGNTVTKLRASDGTPLGTFLVGDSASGIAFDGANMWVVCSGQLYKL
jgi:hypothetical protein